MNRADATSIVADLHDSWYPYLVRYAIRVGVPVALAEEAVQETFVALYKALLKGQRVENERAWTLRVLRRQLGHMRASEERARLNASTVEDLDALPVAVEQTGALEYDDLYRAMRLLTPREIEVIMLRLKPMKYAEIARELGISTPSVGTLLMRAIRKLRGGMGVTPYERATNRLEEWDEPGTLQ
ncbi:MAG: sigma-70 family RNA polymerase sigma factor [Acidobacteria bacterium]|nr:sigma-70 family RNA polymerase sigma factor [Acidobacteriota bacterium]